MKPKIIIIILSALFVIFLVVLLFQNNEEHVQINNPITSYDEYNYGESDKIIDIGIQPLWIPTNIICEVMKRDLILKEVLDKMGMELRFHNYLKGADVNNYILKGELEAGIGGDMPAVTISAESDILIPVLIQHGFTSIVSKHHMVINELGAGTSIIIYLPLSMEKEKVDETPVELIKGSANILFIDDEEDIRDVAGQILEDLGYSVVLCENGLKALEYYKKEWDKVDAVVIDIAMPEMNGVEAFKAMKIINPEIKVLISTGFSMNGEVQNVLDSGAKDFIQKPFNIAELSGKLSSILNI